MQAAQLCLEQFGLVWMSALPLADCRCNDCQRCDRRSDIWASYWAVHTHTHITHTHTVALNRLTVNWLIVQCLRYSSQLRRWTHKVHTSLILAVIHVSLVERHRAKIVPVHQKDVIYSWTHPRHLMWIAQCWNWSYQACREWLKIGEVCLLRISKHVNSMMDCIMTDLCTVIISCWHVFAVSVLCDLLNDRKAFVNDC